MSIIHRILHALLAPLPVLVPAVAQSIGEVEPNDTVQTATLVPAGREIVAALGAGDADWFAVDLPVLADLRAMTGPGRGAQVGDTRLDLVDPSGTLVLATNDDFEGRGWYSQVTRGELLPGRYYLRVTGFSGSTTGTYALDIIVAPPRSLTVTFPTPVADLEGPEENDVRVNPAGATLVPPDNNRSYLGNIAVGGGAAAWDVPFAGGPDYDVYQFTLTTASLVVLETVTGAPGAAVTDSVLHLIQPGTLVRLLVDDDSGAGALSRISTTLAAGSYLVAVNAFAQGGGGSYLLNIQAVVPPPSAPATFTEHLGGCSGTTVPRLLNRVVSTAHAIAIERPFLGSEFCVDVVDALPGALVMEVVGLQLASPPLDLGAVGAPGCGFELDLFHTLLALTDGVGVHTWCQRIPYDSRLLGLPLQMQALCLDPGANALGVTLTNRGTAICGTAY